MIARLSVLLLLPAPAWACAVCGGGGPNQQAFIDTMIFMTVTPLLMLGGTATFLWYRWRQVSADQPTHELPRRYLTREETPGDVPA